MVCTVVVAISGVSVDGSPPGRMSVEQWAGNDMQYRKSEYITAMAHRMQWPYSHHLSSFPRLHLTITMFTPIVLALCGAAAVAAIPHPFADFVSEGKVMVATEEGKSKHI